MDGKSVVFCEERGRGAVKYKACRGRGKKKKKKPFLLLFIQNPSHTHILLILFEATRNM